MQKTEQELLLLCARMTLKPAEEERLQALLRSPLDWRILLRAAQRHGLAPLVFHHLSQMGEASVKVGTEWPQLQGIAHSNALRNARLFEHLGSLLEQFAQAGLRVVVLKGAALAEQAYPHPGLRPMVDVDLWVSSSDLPAAHRLLVHQGYVLQKASTTHLDYVHTRFPETGLELHWALWPTKPKGPFRWSVAQMSARVIPAPVAGAPAWRLAPEDELLHLILHHFWHGLESLLNYCDLAALLNGNHRNIDWAVFAARVEEARAGSVVGYVLHWVQDYLQVPIPPNLLAAWGPCPASARFLLRCLDRGPIPADALIDNGWAHLIRQIGLIEGTANRLRWAVSSLCPAPPSFPPVHPLEGPPNDSVGFRLRRRLRNAREMLSYLRQR